MYPLANVANAQNEFHLLRDTMSQTANNFFCAHYMQKDGNTDSDIVKW